VIVRILGVGQYRVDEADLPGLEAVDDRVEQAIAEGNDTAFQAALGELVDAIVRVGTPLPADEFVGSDIVVPDRDTTLAEARAMGADEAEGLIPG
jgi:hypothetical protein